MSLARAIFDDLTVLADATRARLLLLIERHELLCLRIGQERHGIERNGLQPPSPLPARVLEDIRQNEPAAEDWWWFYTAEVGAPRRSAAGL